MARHFKDPARVAAWLESTTGEEWARKKFKPIMHNFGSRSYGYGFYNVKLDNELGEQDVAYWDAMGYGMGALHLASDEDWYDPCGGKPIDPEDPEGVLFPREEIIKPLDKHGRARHQPEEK